MKRAFFIIFYLEIPNLYQKYLLYLMTDVSWLKILLWEFLNEKQIPKMGVYKSLLCKNVNIQIVQFTITTLIYRICNIFFYYINATILLNTIRTLIVSTIIYFLIKNNNHFWKHFEVQITSLITLQVWRLFLYSIV